MRVLLAGTPEFAKIIFENLSLDSQNLGVQILGLLTQADKPFGRKQELKAPATKEFFQAHLPHLPIFQNLDSQTLESIKGLKPDLIIVVAFGRILDSEFLQIAPCVNIHASILPHLRGASPLQEMILQNGKLFGVSIMKMVQKLDAGDVLGFRFCENVGQDIQALSAQLANEGYLLLKEILQKLNAQNFENLSSLKQCDADASYCKKVKKEYGCVDFDNAKQVFLKYLAYKNWPGIFLENGLKITQILGFASLNSEADSENFKDGQILEINKDFVKVACKNGALKIAKVQPAGKKEMAARDYLLGKRAQVGEIFG